MDGGFDKIASILKRFAGNGGAAVIQGKCPCS